MTNEETGEHTDVHKYIQKNIWNGCAIKVWAGLWTASKGVSQRKNNKTKVLYSL